MSRRIVRTIFKVLFGNSATHCLIIVAELLLAGILGAAAFGYFALSVSLALTASSLSLFGTQLGLVHFFTKIDEDNQRASQHTLIVRTLLFVIGTASLMSILTYCFSSSISTGLFSKSMLRHGIEIAVWIIPFESTNRLLSSAFRARRQTLFYVLSNGFIRNLFLLLSVIAAGILNYSWVTVLFCYFIGTAATSFVGLLILYRQKNSDDIKFKGFDAQISLGALLKFSFPMFLVNVLQLGVSSISILIAGVYLKPVELGVYSLFVKLCRILVFFQTATNAVISVEFSTLYHKMAVKDLRHLFLGISYSLFICASLVSIPVVLSPWLLEITFGSTYAVHAPWLYVLWCAYLVSVGTGPIGQLLVYSGNQVAAAWTSFLSAGVLISGSVILMPRFGIAGAVAAQAAALITLTCSRHLAGLFKLKIHAFTRAYFLMGLFFCVVLLVGLKSTSVSTVLVPLAAFCVYALMLVLYIRFDPQLYADLRRLIVR